MVAGRDELEALKNIISEVDLILETTPDLPQNRTGRSRELLHSALALVNDLLKHHRSPAAKALGRKGGSAIAKRDVLLAKLAAQEQTVRDTTKMINDLLRHIDKEPMFADLAEPSSTRSMSIRPDQFYGRPLATVAKEVLDREAAEWLARLSWPRPPSALDSGAS